MRIQRQRWLMLMVLSIFLVSCTSPSPAPTTSQTPPGQGQSSQPSQPSQPTQRKSITIVMPSDINALVGGVGLAGINSQSSTYAKEFINSFMTTMDQERNVYPMLAAELPSIEKGTWVLHDDG